MSRILLVFLIIWKDGYFLPQKRVFYIHQVFCNFLEALAR
jgi:hypothetical protein